MFRAVRGLRSPGPGGVVSASIVAGVYEGLVLDDQGDLVSGDELLR